MSTAITGACGEHYVASFLSGYGMVVALPRAGVKGADLFVAEVEAGPPVRIQVKTGKQAFGSDKTGDYYVWDTSYKVLERPDPNLWFAYLWLNGWPQKPTLPKLFFVPSDVVLAHMKTQEAAKKKRPFFWMYAQDLEKHRDENGITLLRNAMKPIAT